MKTLKIERTEGDDVQAVYLYGNPKKQPEPTHFRVVLPFGCVDIARCSDGSYWVHVIRAREDDVKTEMRAAEGVFMDARLHAAGLHASEANLGDFDRRDLYDVAVRIGAAKGGAR